MNTMDKVKYKLTTKKAEHNLRIVNTKAASDILSAIWDKPSFVQEIQDMVDRPQCEVSLHLSKLRSIKAVTCERYGKYKKYAVNKSRLKQIYDLCEQLKNLN
jgi:DNA-binding transcriptional ArsR family regulator